jgi:hypothetical protein
VAIGLVVMFTGTPVMSQVLTDRANAATWYQRAIDSFANVSEAHQHALANYDGGVPSPAVRAALAKAGPALHAMRAATGRRASDFELDLSQGFDLLLPHLSPMRQLQSAFSAAAMVDLHDGNGTAAVKSVMSMITASGDLRSDQTLISSLVGSSMFDLADSTVDQLAQFGELDKDAAIALRRRFKGLDADDPFGLGDAMETERTMLSTVANDYQTAVDEGADSINLAALLPSGNFGGDEIFASPQDFASEIEGLHTLSEDLAAVTLNPDIEDAKAQWEQIESRLEQGDYGVLAGLVAPSLGGILELLEESRARVQAKLSMLNAVIAGEVDPEDSLNAAAFYLQAAGLLARAPLASQSAIDMIIASDEDVVDPELILEFQKLGDIINPLHKAMLASTCDFAAIVGDTPAALITTWIPGQRLLARYLLASALLAMKAKEDPLPWINLKGAHALDMGRQHHLTASLVAAASLNETLSLDPDIVHGPLPDTLVRLTRMPTADPLGFDRGIGRARSVIAEEIDRRLRYPEGTDGEQAAGDALIEVAAATDTNALMAWMAIHEEERRRQVEQPPVIEDRSLLADVLSIPAIDAVTSKDAREPTATPTPVASLPAIADIDGVRATVAALMIRLESLAMGGEDEDVVPVSE